MAIRPVLLVPDPRLKQSCAWVERFDDSLRAMIRDLEDTRAANPGCVGIAACQIGELSRVAIVNTAGHRKYGSQSQGHMVLINPIITAQEGERMGREGCLSLPDFTANVRRALNVSVAFQDGIGQEHRIETTDFEAVVIQHEIDHLDGILFLDRVANLATDVFPRKNK
ncbi:MAG TPA: peptide deformylase [Abditibacteriaceae bacterium]|nr:peptide deformylase [Abditibacteriaceae bacterium]